MELRLTIEHEERGERATFVIEVTHFDPGTCCGGAMDEDSLAELEFHVQSVSINDGPEISPVPDDIHAAYESLIDERVAETMSDRQEHIGERDDNNSDFYDEPDYGHAGQHYDFEYVHLVREDGVFVRFVTCLECGATIRAKQPYVDAHTQFHRNISRLFELLPAQ